MLDHYRQVKVFWDKWLPGIPENEVHDFARETYLATNGNPDEMADLAAISIMECGGGTRLNHLKAFLGCQKKVYVKGSMLLGDHLKYRQLNANLGYKIRCGATVFRYLDQKHGEEHAIREWNQGQKWASKSGERYYLGVMHFREKFQEVGK